MKRVIKYGPGVMTHVAVKQPYAGETLWVYDDNKLIAEIELDNIPALLEIEPLFFKHNLTVKHGNDVDVEVGCTS
jgi:hypothetical protein